MPSYHHQPHLFPRLQNTYSYNSIGGPGPLAGLVIGLIIVFAIAVLVSWALHHQNKRRKGKEAKLERQRRWYDAELRRGQSAAVGDDDDVPDVRNVGRPEGVGLSPQYAEIAVPLKSLDPRVVR